MPAWLTDTERIMPRVKPQLYVKPVLAHRSALWPFKVIQCQWF